MALQIKETDICPVHCEIYMLTCESTIDRSRNADKTPATILKYTILPGFSK